MAHWPPCRCKASDHLWPHCRCKFSAHLWPNRRSQFSAILNGALELTKVEGDEFDLRRFNPSTYGFRPNAVPSDVLVRPEPDGRPLLQVKPPANCDQFCFALYADGACSGNGTPQARASVGVHGTPDAGYNRAYILPSDVPQTKLSAEIHSAIAAVDVARAIIKKYWNDFHLPESDAHVYSIVLLVMDSRYVVGAMTAWFRTWRDNGFRTPHGESVTNMEAFRTLDNKIRELLEDHLLIVRFWHVPRIHNVDADRLAAEALRGISLESS